MAYIIGVPETEGDNKITVVTNNATAFPLYKFTPKNAEKGSMVVDYICGDGTGAGINRRKSLGWRKTHTGVLTVTVTAYPSPAGDTGMTAPDFTAVAVSADIEIRVSGIAGKDIRHKIILEVQNSVVLDAG